jgi:ADP-heptose:LPS heptosyltransferase
MNTAYLQLGKIGDVLSILPLLSFKHDRSNIPQNLVISKEYADTVTGLDYINADILDIHWQDLESAIKYAKTKYDKAYCPQTYGKNIAIAHHLPSFQLDQWQRCGELNLFDKLPLVIPRPANTQELVARYLGGRPAILFADQGESSQFEMADQLAATLHREFGNSHQIVRLSSIRLEKFTDFVALYDSADCLIVTETAHLHLSKATSTPVFALATDHPELWHGSAWSQKFKLHIRYSQFKRREQELIEGIRSVL